MSNPNTKRLQAHPLSTPIDPTSINQANRGYDPFHLSDDELDEDRLSDELRDEQIDEANAELASADPTLELDMLDLNAVELDEISEVRRALRLRDSGLDDGQLDGEL